MTLDDLDLKLYLYNPSDDKSIKELIKSYEEFQEDLGEIEKEKLKIVKYIILFYDLNGDLKNKESNFMKRKGIAAQLSGFKLNKSKHFQEEIRDILIGYNEKVNKMIIRYLLLFNNPDYIELQVATDLYNKQALKAMQTKVNANAKDVEYINNNLTKLNEKIKETTNRVFGGKESMQLEQALYYYMEKDRLKYRPEDIANVQDGNAVKDYDLYNLF